MYVVGGIVLFLVLFVIVVYNGFVRKRNMVKNSFSSIDVNLMKRADLIPSLVETVKGYAAHEKQTLTQLTQLRQQIQQTYQGGVSPQRLELEEQVRPALGQLFAVAEAYPDLKADSQFLNLQRNLTEVEEQLSASRRSYNASVMAMNTSVSAFPTNIVASLFGFKEVRYFEAAEDKRGAVATNFTG